MFWKNLISAAPATYLFRVDETLALTENHVSNADVVSLLGFTPIQFGGNGTAPGGNGLLLTDTVCQGSFQSLKLVSPYPVYELTVTLAGLSVYASEPSSGYYLWRQYSAGLTFFVVDGGSSPAMKIYDGATLITTFTGSSGLPWYIGVIGCSTHAIYIIDYTDSAQLFPIWRFDRAANTWTQLVASTGREYTNSNYLYATHPTLCVTPDADFISYADFSKGHRNVLACNADGTDFIVPTTDSYLSGSSSIQQEKFYDDPKSRTLLFSNVAVYDVEVQWREPFPL